MKMKPIVLAIGLAVGGIALATPPEHAQNDRMQYQGHELMFDQELQVYVVEDQEDVYFVDGTFYRFDGDGWVRAAMLADPDWEVVEMKAVPKTLVKVHKSSTRVVDAPPAHAPAHGYRMQHEGIDLVFDDERQVYLVEGRDGIYFHDGAFFTVQDGTWVRTYELVEEPEWEVIEIEPGILPEPLITLETPDLAVELEIG